jgi:hypothetical protein
VIGELRTGESIGSTGGDTSLYQYSCNELSTALSPLIEEGGMFAKVFVSGGDRRTLNAIEV